MAPRSWKSWVSPVLVGVGLISVVYYLMTLWYIGFDASFYLFWLVLGLLCFSAAYVWEKKGRSAFWPTWAKWLLGVVSAAVLVGFLVIQAAIVRASLKEPTEDLDVLVVLGARVDDEGPMPILRDRLDAAFAYAKAHPQTTVVVTGGQGPDEPRSEGAAMYDYLVGKGLSGDRIVVEDRSTNTHENFAYAKALIPEGTQNIGVVTSNYHIYRSVLLAQAVFDVPVHGVPASSDKLLYLHNTVREFFALIKDRLVGHIK